MAFQPMASVTLLPSFFEGLLADDAPNEMAQEVVALPWDQFKSGHLKALLLRKIPGGLSRTLALKCKMFLEMNFDLQKQCFADAGIYTYPLALSTDLHKQMLLLLP